MSLVKKLAGQTAIYGLSSVLGRTFNYLLVPLYTTVFAPGEYGIVTELYAYVAFLNILYIYGLETAYFRFAGDGENDSFNISFTSILISSVVFSVLLFLLSYDIARALDYEGQEPFIQWLALIMGIDAVVAIPFARLRQQGKAKRFAIFKLSNISINIGLNLFFLVLCPWVLSNSPNHWLSHIYNQELGVGYVFLSNLIANGFYLLFFIPIWIKTQLRIDYTKWKEMVSYAWPILIVGFAGVTNEMLSRALLKHRLPEGFYQSVSNLEVLGIFGACYKLSIFMTLAIQAFRYAFEPFIFVKAKEKDSPQVFSTVMTWFVLFVAFSWLLVSTLLPYIAPIFLRQQSYLQALDAVPWLLGGALFLGIFYNLSIWYKLTDNTRYGAVISVTGALATLVLNWTLIPILGYMGSAYATFTSYLLMTLISYFWGRKHYPVPYNLMKILGYISLAAIGIIVNNQFAESIWISMGIIGFFLTLPLLFERRTLVSKKA